MTNDAPKESKEPLDLDQSKELELESTNPKEQVESL